MDNKEIALQLTLHAMDNDLIDTTPCNKDRDYASSGLAESNATKIVEFYNHVIQLLADSSKEYQEQD